MTDHHPVVRCRALVVCLSLVLLAAPARGQEAKGFAKEGGFAAIAFLPGFTFDGVTFDGESVYQEIGGEEVMILPRVTSTDMIRVALGYRARQASIEVSYERTKHDGTFMEGSGEAVFQSVNIDGRFFLLTGHRVQPHILVGGSMPRFTVKDGSFLDPNIPDAAVADASFKGYGLNTEAGVTIYPHRQFGVSVGYNYRILSFGDVKGASKKLFRLKPRFKETSGAVVATAHVIF